MAIDVKQWLAKDPRLTGCQDDPSELDTEPIELDDAPKHLHKRVHRHTIYRWWLYGIQGIHLETVKLAGRRYTTREALADFLFATNKAAPRGSTARPNTPAPNGRRAKEQVAKAL